MDLSSPTPDRDSMQSTLHDEDDFGLDPSEELLPEKGRKIRQRPRPRRSCLHSVGKWVLISSLALAGFTAGYYWPRNLDQLCFRHTSMYCKLIPSHLPPPPQLGLEKKKLITLPSSDCRRHRHHTRRNTLQQLAATQQHLPRRPQSRGRRSMAPTRYKLYVKTYPDLTQTTRLTRLQGT